MLIARWLFLLAGLTICVATALFLVTRKPVYWRFAKRVFVAAIAAALIFFALLLAERLLLI